MNWIQEKNTSEDLGDSIKFELYAYGEGLRISIDEINWINPTQVIDKEHKFDITVRKDGKIGQDFWIKEWGYLRFPSEVPKPEVPNSNIDSEYKSRFLGSHSYDPQPLLDEFKPIYCSFIQSDFKDKQLIRCEFPAFGIVYNDGFIDDFDKGKRVRPRVELYNENGELELLMDNDNYSTKKGVKDNNHVYYINIPQGKKRVVIINKENSDFPLLTEIFRQTSEHPTVRHEWGDNTILYPNERKEYFVDFTYQGLANELFKINCVTRW
jgi:hypothetical protein